MTIFFLSFIFLISVSFKEDGQPIALDEKTGTNILGELIEASDWSANKLLYGDMHNFGHYAMCYVHDPDRSHSVKNDVMLR